MPLLLKPTQKVNTVLESSYHSLLILCKCVPLSPWPPVQPFPSMSSDTQEPPKQNAQALGSWSLKSNRWGGGNLSVKLIIYTQWWIWKESCASPILNNRDLICLQLDDSRPISVGWVCKSDSFWACVFRQKSLLPTIPILNYISMLYCNHLGLEYENFVYCRPVVLKLGSRVSEV